jgi:hypothetical protein
MEKTIENEIGALALSSGARSIGQAPPRSPQLR